MKNRIRRSQEGANDGFSCAYFINKLLKYLKSKSIYQIKAPVFILDNSSFHKSFWLMNKLIGCKCHFLFTAPNTSQNNPIEYLFSDLKRFIRKMRPTNRYVPYNFDYTFRAYWKWSTKKISTSPGNARQCSTMFDVCRQQN